MIYSYADVRTLAAVATTRVQVQGLPSNENYVIREIRVPCSVVTDMTVNIFIDGKLRYELIPSTTDNVLAVLDDVTTGAQVEIDYVKNDVTSTVVGFVIVVDRQPK